MMMMHKAQQLRDDIDCILRKGGRRFVSIEVQQFGNSNNIKKTKTD